MAQAPNIRNIAAVHSRGDMQGVAEPGAFTTFDDHTAIFTGNGEVTPEQATGHYINHLAKSEAAFAAFAGNPHAATFGAQFFLQQNQHLRNTTARTPIAKGEQFNMDGMRLKDLLKPFANNLTELRNMVENMSTAAPESSSAMDRATGNVRTQGRTLPPF